MLVKNGDEQRILRRMLALQRRGNGPTAIVSKLNAEGQLTRTGAEWTRQGVHRAIERHLDRAAVLRR